MSGARTDDLVVAALLAAAETGAHVNPIVAIKHLRSSGGVPLSLISAQTGLSRKTVYNVVKRVVSPATPRELPQPVPHRGMGTLTGVWWHRGAGGSGPRSPLCPSCREAQNAYQREYKKRQPKPGPKTPTPIDHGTLSGARKHRWRNIPMCEDCAAAERAYGRESMRRSDARAQAK